MAFNRRPGAQRGNKNAFKHGFYAGALGAKGQKVLRDAQRIDPKELQHEIDLMRATMYKIAALDKQNLTVLVLVGRLLVKMIATKYAMSQEQEADIHDSFRALIIDLQALPPATEETS